MLRSRKRYYGRVLRHTRRTLRCRQIYIIILLRVPALQESPRRVQITRLSTLARQRRAVVFRPLVASDISKGAKGLRVAASFSQALRPVNRVIGGAIHPALPKLAILRESESR